MLECSDVIGVTVYPKPVASFISTTEVIAAQQPVVFTNTSEGAVSWNWEFGDGETSAEENPEHLFNISGDYTVSLTAVSDQGCEDLETRSFGIITATEDSHDVSISFSPNPVRTKSVTISRPVANESAEIKIFNIQGKELFSTSLLANEAQANLDVSNLSNGIYVALMRSNGKTVSTKILIAR
jgi:PKD repeat protein